MEQVRVKKSVDMSKALIWSNLLSEPLATLYTLVTLVLYKGLGASPFQVALLVMLKPVVTILSFYWGSGLKGQGKRLKSNVIWAGIWMRLPFILCPFFDSIGYVIFASVNYMFFLRASSPAWIEILKRNLGENKRGKAFSTSASLGYLEGIFLAIGMGVLLDQNPTCWKVLFSVSALIGLVSIVFQARVPLAFEDEVIERISLKEKILRPWKDSYFLIKNRPDFAMFQWGFMACGFGIMLIQPVIPLFAVDVLGITYLEMTIAISIAKGLGFALSSPFWAKGLERVPISRLASFVFITVGLFPILMGASKLNLIWFFIAYFWYGVGQGGSHLIWNLSGPTFAGKEDSSRYTGVGVVLAGIRGGFGPPLGSQIATLFGPIAALGLGGLFCFCSGLFLIRRKPVVIKASP